MPDHDPLPDQDVPFLRNGGQLGRLIARHDWAQTSVGPIESWPAAMRSTVAMLLRSPVAMVTLWGERGVMIYNDAYSVFAGKRHPGALGASVREAWPEVAEFNDTIVRTVFRRGQTLSYAEQEMILYRSGRPERVWMNLDYSPVVDESGQPLGVIAIVVEATERVLAERRVAAERDRLAQLFEQSPSFVAIHSGPEHRFDLVNPRYRALVGDRPLEGLPVAEALPEIVDQGYVAMLDEVLRTGEAFSATGSPFHRTIGGDDPAPDRFLDFVMQPITGRDDAVVGIFVEGADVTDRVLAEQEVHRVQESLELALNAGNGIGTWDWDVPNDRVVSDERFATLYGVDPAMAKAGAPLAEFFSSISPEDTGRVAAEVDRAVVTGDDFVSEYRLIQADGSEKWVIAQGRCMRDANGTPSRFPGVSFDISERKKAEEQLRVLNNTLEAQVAERTRERDRIWSSSPDLMGVADASGRFIRTNPAWQKTLGWSAEEIAATPIADLVHPDDLEGTMAEFHGLLDGVPSHQFENRYRAKDGSYRWQQWAAVPEGGLIYAVARDVTEAHAQAEELERTAEALRQSQKMEAVGQLTGGIAHDFNNLLQGISGSLEIIQRRTAQGRIDDLERFITGASTAAARAAALTHRLLAFSRRQPLDPRPLRANPLVASMEDMLRRTIGEGIELELVLAGGLWLTLCDANQLENALLNLVINARDAMPTGGKLTIETCNTHLDSAYAASQRDVKPGQYVCVCVTDTGQGMSAETIAKAFDPFFTTKPIGQGTGLGLSMIYGFARQSEGYAKIYSVEGEGTTVKLYLPRHRGEADTHEPTPALGDAHLGEAGEVVLVIEDEAVVRSLIVETLTELGYAALEAADGPRGLEILQSDQRIDLLITDIGLPGLNGRQVADAACALRPALRVLFMTGYAENAARAAGFLQPGMSMLTKPFAMEALATRIRAMIEGTE